MAEDRQATQQGDVAGVRAPSASLSLLLRASEMSDWLLLWFIISNS